MPGREIPLVTNEIYHVMNRGTAGRPTFQDKRDYTRACATLFYYQSKNPPIKYSKFLTLSTQLKEKILEKFAKEKELLVEIIAYCLMPNHFHLLLRQLVDNGISKFMSNFSNSYTRYLNTKLESYGSIYQGKFKAVRIETNEQLFHVNRYIHLNPYASHMVKSITDLTVYPYSSLPEYLGRTTSNLCAKQIILDDFKSIDSYQKFVFDQADYQRQLNDIKHLILEEI